MVYFYTLNAGTKFAEAISVVFSRKSENGNESYSKGEI